ncbi:unnamed protein product [Brachionus calyciflorus]|uniref:Uncharacterized protein n=1 Tax=Brachionus calyciflorus TaxID=104777 RepID=A0A813XV88_9BILA|nr:unnamed protein product [Brachionus calyciflorus]
MSKKPTLTKKPAAKTTPAKVATSKTSSEKASAKLVDTPPQPSEIPQLLETPKKVNVKPEEADLRKMVSLITDNPEDTEPCYAVVDETTRVSAFLRHRNTTYFDCMDSVFKDPERLRFAIIASIRFGKALVFDLIDLPQVIDSIEETCSKISENLFEELCDRSILRHEKYLKYVKEGQDGDDFKSYYFQENIYKNFKVVFLTTKASDKYLSLGKNFIIV